MKPSVPDRALFEWLHGARQEEHLWNYVPDGGDSCSGTTQAFQAAALPFVQKTNATIGSTYLKARSCSAAQGGRHCGRHGRRTCDKALTTGEVICGCRACMAVLMAMATNSRMRAEVVVWNAF